MRSADTETYPQRWNRRLGWSATYLALIVMGVVLTAQLVVAISWAADVDWSAVGSMIGGVGSIIAVGVAVALSEVQHRRTLALFAQQKRLADQEREREKITLAIWAASVIMDLGDKAKLTGDFYQTMKLDAPNLDEPQPFDAVADIIQCLSLGFEPVGERLSSIIDRFSVRAASDIVPAIRMSSGYDGQRTSASLLLRSGQMTAKGVKGMLEGDIHALAAIHAACIRANATLCEEYGLRTVDNPVR